MANERTSARKETSKLNHKVNKLCKDKEQIKLCYLEIGKALVGGLVSSQINLKVRETHTV